MFEKLRVSLNGVWEVLEKFCLQIFENLASQIGAAFLFWRDELEPVFTEKWILAQH